MQGGRAGDGRESLEPQAQQDHEAKLDRNRRQKRAGRSGGGGVGGRQPAVHGKERSLDQKPRRHQPQRHDRRQIEARDLCQQGHVDRVVIRHQKRHAQKIGQRAQHRDHEIAQRRRKRPHRGQRHGCQADHLQRDVEVEKVGGQKTRIGPGPHQVEERPECLGRGRAAIIAARRIDQRMQPDGTDYQCARQYHQPRDPVGAQKDAQRQVPVADQQRCPRRQERQPQRQPRHHRCRRQDQPATAATQQERRHHEAKRHRHQKAKQVHASGFPALP